VQPAPRSPACRPTRRPSNEPRELRRLPVLPVRAAQTRQAADGASGLIAGELDRSPDDETLRPRSARGRMAAIGTVALTHDPATVLAEAVDAHRCRATAKMAPMRARRDRDRCAPGPLADRLACRSSRPPDLALSHGSLASVRTRVCRFARRAP
jgi:hypothetical protein